MIRTITLPADTLQAYFKVLVDYFGTNDVEFIYACQDGDDNFPFMELVSRDKIVDLLKKYNFPIDQEDVITGLYMNANVNYGDAPKFCREHFFNRDRYDTCKDIKLDLLKLYPHLKAAGDQPLKLSFGKGQENIVKLTNAGGWLTTYLLNAFERWMYEIDTVEKAEALYKEMSLKKTGAKKQVDFLATCLGVARLFKDYGLIEGDTTVDMCRFIKEYLVLMKADEKDQKKDEDTIGSNIRQNIKTEPVRHTPSSGLEGITNEDYNDVTMCDILFFKKGL